MLGSLLPLHRANDWRIDPYCHQRGHSLGFPGLVPGGPATRMQPYVAVGFDAVGQQRIVGVFTIAASETPPCRRAFRIAVQPFADAAVEGLGLCLRTRQPAIELDDAGAFIKDDLPVLRRPAAAAGAQQRHDLGLVTGERIEHRGRRCRGCLQRKVIAIECEFYTGGAGRLESLDRAHSRVLQPGAPVFSGPDWGGGFASGSSAAVQALSFKGLARTVGALPLPLPSAASATVRTG